jgi:DinB superfamily
MDRDSLLQSLDFSRGRLMGTLDAIEKSGQPAVEVLGWRPGPGRAHMGWQFMHCAATHDRYLNVRLKESTEKDPELVAAYGGGSTPSDANIPTFAEIRTKLEQTYTPFRQFVAAASEADLAKSISFPNNVQRTLAESALLMAWHEAHHQGQIHLTWNMYKAAYEIG